MTDLSPDAGRPASSSLVAKFLGPEVAPTNPVTLLGIDSDLLTEDAVMVGLRSRLEVINASPLADTGEADEVRMILHAAAARLLGALQRRTPAEQSLSRDSVQPLHAALAMGGGWTRDSIRHIAMMAKANGLDPAQLIDAVRVESLDPPPPAPRPRPGTAPPSETRVAAADRDRAVQPADTSTPEHSTPGSFGSGDTGTDSSRKAITVVMAFVGLGLVGLLAAGVLVIILLTTPKQAATASNDTLIADSPPKPAPPGPGPAGGTSVAGGGARPPAPPGPAKSPPMPPAPARLGDFNDCLRDLEAAGQAASVDPEAALDGFLAALERGGREWGSAAPDALVAASGHVVEFLYRMQDHPDLALRAVHAIAAFVPAPGSVLGADEVGPAAWGAGLLSRLMRERDLPLACRDQVREAFLAAYQDGAGPAESSFRSGAATALSAMPPRLLPAAGVRDASAVQKSIASWRAWLAALGALDAKLDGPAADGPNTTLRNRAALGALEWLLQEAPEPTQDAAVYEAVTLLTTTVSWRDGDEARRALLRWFDSPRVSLADLQAVTAALATRSGAEGVDYSMVITLAAGDSQRPTLRERYATAWNLSPSVSRSSLLEKWVQKATEAVQMPASGTPNEALGRAVTMSRLSLAMTQLWRGETEGAESLITASPMAPVANGANSIAAKLYPGDSDGDHGWVVKYIAMGSHIPGRRDLLTRATDVPTAMEAEVLVDEATRGSPAVVRADARAIVLRFSNEPTIINAMLEAAPTLPPTMANAELVRRIALASTPSPRDPNWRFTARRVLVERLLQVAAGASDTSFVDSASRELADQYAAAVRTPSAPSPDGANSPPPQSPPAEDSTAALRARMMREAEALIATGREPLGVAAIAARRAGRASAARGGVQTFVAEQATICELLGFVTVNEQPGRADQVRAVQQDLDAARRAASHVFEQIEAAERARLRLWLVRSGEGPA